MKTEKQQKSMETVLGRPKLVTSQTGNVGLVRGDEFVYVKIAEAFDELCEVGTFVRLAIICPGTYWKYTGPIDDQMMANIMIYGG